MDYQGRDLPNPNSIIVPFQDKMATSLPQLAEELVQRVLESLGPKDTYSIRLTCRALEKKSHYFFRKTLFRTRSYPFSRSGIQSLLHIARIPNFAPCIEELTFTFERWNHLQLHAALWDICNRHGDRGWPSIKNFSDSRVRRMLNLNSPSSQNAAEMQERTVEMASVFRKEMGDRLDFIEGGCDLHLLSKALSLLPHLHTIELKEAVSSHCFQESGYECGTGVFYAWPILGEEMGGLHRLQAFERHNVFPILLLALANNHETKQSNPQLETLKICVSKFEFFNPPSYVVPSLAKNLQSVSITFTTGWYDLRNLGEPLQFGEANSSRTLSEENADRAWLLEFIQSCPNLKRLELNIRDYDAICRVFHLGNVASQVSTLEHIGLSGGLMDFRSGSDDSQLDAFLLHHKASLKSLSLSGIKTGYSLRIRPGPFYTTRNLLHTLTQLEKLEDLRLEGFAEIPCSRDNRAQAVIFEPQSDRSKNGRDAWIFKGKPEEMRTKLGLLSRDYEVEKLPGQ